VLACFNTIAKVKLEAERMRYHGDYHLGQVLYTGKDFIIIDFEGEPARPLSERRIKRSPLRDIAGMLRSFSYAVSSALGARLEALHDPKHRQTLEHWGTFWQRWVSAVFLRAYLDASRPAGFVPKDPRQLQVLLDASILEKAVYELAYELNNRPDWIGIPLAGIEQLLASPAIQAGTG
jgi:maltose alpha-D-glucosyltransferase/alpha-amylase